MARYILVYKANEANDWSKLPEPEIKQVVQEWGEWVGSIGAARKDGGAFKFGGKSATKTGAKDADNLLTGYVVIDVDGFDAALEIAQKAPFARNGTGTIEVYEAFAS